MYMGKKGDGESGELTLIRSPEVFKVQKGGSEWLSGMNRFLLEKHNICQI